MNSKLWIASRPLVGGSVEPYVGGAAGVPAEHLYIVYDPDGDPTTGDEYIWRGGPSNFPVPTGNLLIENWIPISASEDDHHVHNLDPFLHRNFTEIDTGTQTPEQVKDAISDYTESLNDPDSSGLVETDVPYELLGANSNSAVNSALNSADIDIHEKNPDNSYKNLPEDFSPSDFPGAGIIIDSPDDDSYTVEEGDNTVIVDGAGSDTVTVQDGGHVTITNDNDPNSSNTVILEGADKDDVIIVREGDDLIIFHDDGNGRPTYVVLSGHFGPNGSGTKTLEFAPDGQGNGGVGGPVDLDDPSNYNPFGLLAGLFSNWIADKMEAAWEWIQTFGTPLVLDLDGDGIELVSLNNSNVYWDIDQDGFNESIGWVSGDDGFLGIDLNADGIITDHSELFGNLTTDGFTLLSNYDSNLDGIIDANDTQFSDLIVWQDANENGISESGEILTLGDLNILSIDLNAATPYQMYQDGHHISHTSSFYVDDGAGGTIERDIYDVWFEYDNTDTNYISNYSLDLSTFYTTTLRGYGDLADLHISASADNDITDPDSLMSLLLKIESRELSDLFSDSREVMDEVYDILLSWAQVDNLDPLSRGQWIDARELVFLEKLLGDGYQQQGGPSNPWAGGATGVRYAFDLAWYELTGKLLAQAAGDKLFNSETYYDTVFDKFWGFTEFNQDGLDDLVSKSLDASSVQNKTEYWLQIVNMVDASIGIDNLDSTQFGILESAIQSSDITLTITDLQDKIVKNIDDNLVWTPDGDYILGTSAIDTYDGTVGDDFYSGAAGDDILNGGLGNDQLRGDADNDTLDGQLGNDVLWGGHGDDTYKFFLGHGDDTISDTSGSDKILFGEGITATDLSFIRVGYYDLVIQIDPNVGYGSIHIQNQMSGALIETLEFDDGSTLDMTILDHTYIGTEGNDTIYGVRTGFGGSGVDTIYGEGGDDVIYGYGPTGGSSTTVQNTIYGGEGNDTFFAENGGDYLNGEGGEDVINGGIGNDTVIGGLGNDTLKGNRGDDIYHFNYGDGDDLIYDTRDTDTILMGAGIDASMISAYRENNNDVVLEIDGGLGGTITLQYHTYGSANVIETMEFDDGSTLDLSSFELTLEGTSANETLYGVNIGGSERDTIYGHDGNDIIYGYRSTADTTENFLYGGNGNDTIYGAHGIDIIEGGDGNDTVQAHNGNDQITGGAGDDTLRGHYGDDVYVFNYGDGDDFIEEKSGSDTILLGASITAAMVDVTRLNSNDLMIEIDGGLGGSIELNWHTYGTGYLVETLEFDDGSTLDLTSLDLTMEGTSAADYLYGVNVGGSGVDTIYGYEGNDVIYGYRNSVDTEQNFLYGGDGNDTFYAAHGDDLIYGDDGDDRVFAYNGNDTVYGGADSDTLFGGNHDDLLYGEDGDDFLYGDNNNDTLIGGLGADELTGGGGNDTFTFLAASSFDAVDTIKDFNATYDAIDISDILSGYDPLTDAITDFVQITDDGTDSTLFVDADGGADNFVAIALIDNKVGLTDEAALETAGNLITV